MKEGEVGRKKIDVCANGIAERTDYRWKAAYDGRELSDVRCLRQREDENRRLKQIVAKHRLDFPAMRAAVAKK